MAVLVHSLRPLVRRLEVRLEQFLLVFCVNPDALVLYRDLILELSVAHFECEHRDEDKHTDVGELDGVGEQVD
jgi:hypothetical protein